jgi:hypothetical protein
MIIILKYVVRSIIIIGEYDGCSWFSTIDDDVYVDRESQQQCGNTWLIHSFSFIHSLRGARVSLSKQKSQKGEFWRSNSKRKKRKKEKKKRPTTVFRLRALSHSFSSIYFSCVLHSYYEEAGAALFFLVAEKDLFQGRTARATTPSPISNGCTTDHLESRPTSSLEFRISKFNCIKISLGISIFTLDCQAS